jgi:predicted aspartyl protease
VCAFGQTPATVKPLTLAQVLGRRSAALSALGAHDVATLHVSGSLVAAGLNGTFESWTSGGNERYDELYDIAKTSTLRLGNRIYQIDDNDDVRELRGLLLQRQRTEDFIGADKFVSQPKYDTFRGQTELPDRRSVYEIDVAPPDGLPVTVDVDASSFMIDRISYTDEDGIATLDSYDYKAFHGALVPMRQIFSNGDHAFDVYRFTEHIIVDRPVAPDTFALPKSPEIHTAEPVTVALTEHEGHYYAPVTIAGHTYHFLVDSGAQSIVLDRHVAAQLNLPVEGNLEVAGMQREQGLGLARLAGMEIGGAVLPLHSVSVLSLGGATGNYDADGVLGYPLFAEAVVKFDAAGKSMTLASPAAPVLQGERIAVDTDRELVEVNARVNGIDGRFVIDTGNSTELLLFGPFVEAHPYIVPFQNRHFVSDYGIGGRGRAWSAVVDEFDLGTFRLYHRFTSLMMTTQGAFADRFDAGNAGIGILRNFVVTFDLPQGAIYLQQSAAFDDGRDRPTYENNPVTQPTP